jgi:hypothetical protein
MGKIAVLSLITGISSTLILFIDFLLGYTSDILFLIIGSTAALAIILGIIGIVNSDKPSEILISKVGIILGSLPVIYMLILMKALSSMP